MSQPTPAPAFLVMKTAPGAKAQAAVTFTAPSDAADVGAKVTGATGEVVVTSVVALRSVWRRMTEDEINKLPPFPPSIRQKARESGRVREIEEAGRSDGSAPLAVASGDQLSIVVETPSATPLLPDAFTGALTISAETWSPAQVPLVLLVGSNGPIPMIDPASITRSGRPGETVTQDLVIASTPTGIDGKMIAWVEGDHTVIRLRVVVVYRRIKKKYTEEEIQKLPPFPPSIREDARRDGYFEYQEVARSDGSAPLTVAANQLIRFYVDFVTGASDFPDGASGQLHVDATGWGRVTVPLSFAIEDIDVSLSTEGLTLHQGSAGALTATITSRAGPDTDVRLALGMSNGGVWSVAPVTVHVPRNATVNVPLQVTVAPTAPIGSYPVGLEVRGFDSWNSREYPFQLTVTPGAVTVVPVATSYIVLQGANVACDFRIANQGGYKRVTLTPGLLPAGVHAAPASIDIGPANETKDARITLTIDPRARPTSAAWVPISWAADDGVSRGQTNINLTIQPVLEERTFNQPITTPSGTALGGWAEITIRSNGTYRFRGHLHDSGFDPYAFRIGVIVQSSDGLVSVAAVKSGHVAGTIGSGSRDFDWDEPGTFQLLIQDMWESLRTGTATFTKSYDDTGVLGTLEDIAIALGEFLVGAVAVNPAAAAVIVVGSELGKVTDLPFAHPALIIGAVVGGVILLLGPGAVLPAVVAGVIAGAQVRTRRMRQSEITLAKQVFSDTLPIDRILFSNLSHGGTAFCVPQVDGSILIGLGGVDDGATTRFDDPLKYADWRRTLIHELTHAWQIQHSTTLTEMFWETAINEFRSQQAIYSNFQYDGRPWHKYEIEEQAEIVATWYSIAAAINDTLDSPIALTWAGFPYVQSNIRLGEP